MEKNKAILDLIDRISVKQKEKRDYAKQQDFQNAANARDAEKTLLIQLDELSGVNNFYRKVYDSEKVLRHLDIIVNSTEELKKLRPNFPDILNYSEINKMLVKVYQQRDEAYQTVLKIRESVT